MKRILEAHREFAQKWEASWSKHQDTRKAYEDAQQEYIRMNRLLGAFYDKFIDPMVEPFESGDRAAVDSVIDFLEVDIPAFRCGYAKERFMRKLKSLELTEKQMQRLREVAVRRCASFHYRREDIELRRLMILLADVNLVSQLRELETSEHRWVARKASLMLKVILGGRKDLRKAL